MLDEDRDGYLSRVDVLRGLKSQPKVREILLFPQSPLHDAAEFDAIYRAIDADGSNSIDRREFERYFLHRLTAAPSPPPTHQYPYYAPTYETPREREVRLGSTAAMRFMRAGHDATLRRTGAGALATLGDRASTLAALPHHTGLRTEFADLAEYDELSRSLELSQQKKRQLLAEMDEMGASLRAVESDISLQTAAADRMRATLARHRSSHDALTSHLEARLTQIDRQKLLASRPHLRTADR